jgi:hypothetical protein
MFCYFEALCQLQTLLVYSDILHLHTSCIDLFIMQFYGSVSTSEQGSFPRNESWGFQ